MDKYDRFREDSSGELPTEKGLTNPFVKDKKEEKMNLKEKSLRKILDDHATEFLIIINLLLENRTTSTQFRAERNRNTNQALSAIQSHIDEQIKVARAHQEMETYCAMEKKCKVRRLSGEEILDILKRELPKWKMKSIQNIYDDGTFPLQHIIKNAIFKAQEEKTG